MKNHYIYRPFIIINFFSCFINISAMEDIKKNIETILKNEIYITKETKDNYTTIKLHSGNNSIGRSIFYPRTKSGVFLVEFDIAPEYQKAGIGEQWFYLTLYYIHDEYPTTDRVVWFIVPTNEGLKKDLFKFYRRVGATVDEEGGTGFINLTTIGIKQ